jgi:hypothetical protein
MALRTAGARTTRGSVATLPQICSTVGFPGAAAVHRSQPRRSQNAVASGLVAGSGGRDEVRARGVVADQLIDQPAHRQLVLQKGQPATADELADLSLDRIAHTHRRPLRTLPGSPRKVVAGGSHHGRRTAGAAAGSSDTLIDSGRAVARRGPTLLTPPNQASDQRRE